MIIENGIILSRVHYLHDLYTGKRKSENMFNKLKSNDSDFSSLQHDPYLDIINKNILYITHTVDKCVAILVKLETDGKLQKQVEDYFEDDSKDIPEEK